MYGQDRGEDSGDLFPGEEVAAPQCAAGAEPDHDLREARSRQRPRVECRMRG